MYYSLWRVAGMTHCSVLGWNHLFRSSRMWCLCLPAAPLNDHLAAVRPIARKQYMQEGYAVKNDEKVDIAVNFDRTWQKRGHTSHNGIRIAIDLLTGYVGYNICVHCERFERNVDKGVSSICIIEDLCTGGLVNPGLGLRTRKLNSRGSRCQNWH